MRTTKFMFVGVLLGLSVAGCRGGNATPDGASDTGGGAIHIQDIQSDKMLAKTPVEVHGVIVTAIDGFGTRKGTFWVEEPGGGPFSGVAVFGAPLTQLSNLAVGDVVDITGVKSEFIINGDMSGGSLTEIVAPTGGMLTITKTGTGTVPAPAVVDALMIGMKATQPERNVEWEKWEGVLITVNNVTAGGAPVCIKSKGVCTDVDSLSITGLAKLESGLAAFPTPAIQGGDCFSSITGVLDYAFDYVLYPRATAEIVTGGTACFRENATGPTNLCTDGVDNDGNGFSDCKDFSCEVGPTAWLGTSCAVTDAMCGCSTNLATATGVSKVNTGMAVGAVLLHDVMVTAVGATGFWIADAAQAVSNGGVFVNTRTAPDASIVVGAKLATVQGIAGPFNGSKTATGSVVQINRGTAKDPTASGATLLPITTSSASVLGDLTNGAPFAGSLVQLQNLKVKTVDSAHVVTLVDNTNVTIKMADGALAAFGGTAPVAGDCYTLLTGVMDFNTFDPQTRTINPTGMADMVKGAGCTGN